MNEQILTGTLKINDTDHLEIGGIDTVSLAAKYGTPLYVYDVAQIRSKCRQFKKAFEDNHFSYQVAYASKAFSTLAIYQVVKEEGCSVDVVSGGELYTALKAGFPAEKIHFHGNNKTVEELTMALENKVGCIIVDNFYEIDLLRALTKDRNQKVAVQLRTAPGINAHTHEYITTGQRDSKFGFDLENGQIDLAIQEVLKNPLFDLVGVHCHIGSQIFETEAFTHTVDKMIGMLASWRDKYDYTAKVLNLGGGFGIRYTEADEPKEISTIIDAVCQEVIQQAAKYDYPIPEIWIEPGRSIVGDAGITLYETGSEKDIPGIRNYLAVDGGMTDNIRPALYDAEYTAVIANRATEPAEETYSIAGKCCESGDMLIWDIPLPRVNKKDILAVFSTGAYGYSMANNYNRIPRPAVVFVEDGQDTLVVKRETYEDLIRLDQLI